MPREVMPFKERAKELDKVATEFSLGGFPTTARWIRQLVKTLLLPRVTFGEVLEDLKDVHKTFRSEFIGSNENAVYRQRCFDQFESLILGMIDTRGHKVAFKIFEGLLPAFESGNQALSNLAEIYLALVASGGLSEKRRYYGLCFMYLISVEGLYDENIRALYILKRATKGVDIDYEKIQEKSLKFFKKKLGLVFFEGYNNRIRNAIAHARFRFDEKKNKMVFKDRATKCQPEFSETLSLREFGIKYYGKIDSFCRLRTYHMLFLGIRDLVFAKKPFGKTRLNTG